MEIVRALPCHLDQLCEITDQAKEYFCNAGINQWQYGYPNREVWEDDISKGIAWVAVEEDRVYGAYAYQTFPEPSYGVIDGTWLTPDDAGYASMHRVCVRSDSKGKGIAGLMFAHIAQLARSEQRPSVRIDTHHDNKSMQRALTKAGFHRIGDITLIECNEAGQARVAFEMLV